MTHRRYAPLPVPHRLDPLDRPIRNNELRLKNIYEAQIVFKEKTNPFKKSKHRRVDEDVTHKVKPPIQQLNLAEIKHSNRYHEI